ncbi:hypothetical protein TruAng_009458 [Truncatella angustata]|nr:hypothetical protein TruAng_009458 [Truncatella angustata]
MMSSKSSTITSAAAERVALTPELMELIFLDTDLRTLLVSAQRVCKTWNGIIQSSRQIQCAMFFEPIAPSTDEEITQGRTINPLLADRFPSFFTTARNTIKRTADEEFLQENIKFNGENEPFTFMDDPPRGSTSKRRGPKTVQPTTKRDAFLRTGSSWRRMLPQQPAAPNVGLIEVRGPCERSWYSDVIKPKPEACSVVTMGMLYDMVYRFMGQKGDKSKFCVYWRNAKMDKSHDFSQWYGRCREEYGILADWPDDIGIVVIRNACNNGDWNNSVQSMASLDAKYKPQEMVLYNPELLYKDGEDWFG